jgi:hypothetical protein
VLLATFSGVCVGVVHRHHGTNLFFRFGEWKAFPFLASEEA